jgi:hypothetical protein
MLQDILWKADSHSACQTTVCFLYGTRRFITVFTKARHWTLSWASWIQFAPSIPFSLRFILVLSSHLRLGFPFGPPNQNPVNTSPLPHAYHMSRPPHSPPFNHPNNIRCPSNKLQREKLFLSAISLRRNFERCKIQNTWLRAQILKKHWLNGNLKWLRKPLRNLSLRRSHAELWGWQLPSPFRGQWWRHVLWTAA